MTTPSIRRVVTGHDAQGKDLAKGNDYRAAPMPQKTARVIPIDRQISNSDSLYVVYTEAPS